MITEKWDFSDSAANGTTPQVNRQKSARNLSVVAIDRHGGTGIFLDSRKGQRNTATLHDCDCRDFSFAGKMARKTFKPCMHIYRLAMELGILAPQLEDHAAREARDRHELAMRKEEEDARLRELPRDTTQWGGWNREVHKSGLQKNRQYRAYFILDDEAGELQRVGQEWLIHGYRVRLESCECPDFNDRRLPCKHVYGAAVSMSYALPLTRSEYLRAREQGTEMVFRYDGD